MTLPRSWLVSRCLCIPGKRTTCRYVNGDPKSNSCICHRFTREGPFPASAFDMAATSERVAWPNTDINCPGVSDHACRLGVELCQHARDPRNLCLTLSNGHGCSWGDLAICVHDPGEGKDKEGCRQNCRRPEGPCENSTLYEWAGTEEGELDHKRSFGFPAFA